MTKLILYHGTSKINAEQIIKKGFVPDKSYNWNVKSKKGFVYLSFAYAPFYAIATGNKGNDMGGLIKVEVDKSKLYPDDDFVMYALGKSKYTQEEIDKISLPSFKKYYKESLQYLGNVAIKPKDIKIIGIRIFNLKNLLMVCDPSITPMNYKIMGDYYRKLTE